ncbi:transposable element Tcb2 transposase [Trichonephila clavipes]|nr:transposable element Tcb2 transposase [Trichonephila clavipes]
MLLDVNVSRSVVQRLWDQYQSEDSVSRRPVLGRRATTPAEDRFLALSARREKNHYCAAARCRPLSGRRISATTVRNRLHNADLQWRVIQGVEEQRTRYHQSNTVERHSYRGGGILVWAGISLGGHTPDVFHGGTVTGLRYRDETLSICRLLLLVTNGMIMHDLTELGLLTEDHGLERMEWPARSPDLKNIKRGCCFKSSSKVVT